MKKTISIVLVLAWGLASVCLSAEFTWTQKTDMPTPRWAHSSAVVNGKIYAIGGGSSQPGSALLPTVEEYDPATDTWTTKADMPTARGWISPSSAEVNGKIYVIGGDGGRSVVEEYDPATDAWTRKADMPTGRDYLATVAVDGKIYAIGGTLSYSNGFSTVEVYDPATDTWTKKEDMPMRLWGLCANVVRGKIYTFGGRPGLQAVPRVQEYDPATDTWTRKADMLVGTSQMASAVLGNKIIVVGGWQLSNESPYTAVQMYDPEADIWTREPDAPFLRAGFSACVVNNRIYLIGGTDRPHPCPATSTVYELSVGFPPDFNGDFKIDIEDLIILIEHWHTDYPLCDIAPTPFGDGIVDVQDLIVLVEHLFDEFPTVEPEEVNVDEEDDGSQVELEIGRILIVTLESNPTTGYRWEVVEIQESILEQMGEAEFKQSDTGEPPLVGAGGWEIFRFKAISAGQTSLKLVYHRPWEEGVEPLKTFSIQVVVN